MYGNNKHRPLRMFENQMRARLPNLAVSLLLKKTKKLSSLRHLVNG